MARKKIKSRSQKQKTSELRKRNGSNSPAKRDFVKKNLARGGNPHRTSWNGGRGVSASAAKRKIVLRYQIKTKKKIMYDRLSCAGSGEKKEKNKRKGGTCSSRRCKAQDSQAVRKTGQTPSTCFQEQKREIPRRSLEDAEGRCLDLFKNAKFRGSYKGRPGPVSLIVHSCGRGFLGETSKVKGGGSR